MSSIKVDNCASQYINREIIHEPSVCKPTEGECTFILTEKVMAIQIKVLTRVRQLLDQGLDLPSINPHTSSWVTELPVNEAASC